MLLSKSIVHVKAQFEYDRFWQLVIFLKIIVQSHIKNLLSWYSAAEKRLLLACQVTTTTNQTWAVLPSAQIQAVEHVLLGEHWQMILLDSQVVGVPHGRLSDQQLNYLKKS